MMDDDDDGNNNQEAMEYMRSGNHTGKIVLVNETEGETPLPVCVRSKKPQTVARLGGVYLVTGGAGGFGSQIVNRLVKLGAQHVVVTVSRDAR
jgi:3-oxoacyl-ACP reductase-like protein